MNYLRLTGQLLLVIAIIAVSMTRSEPRTTVVILESGSAKTSELASAISDGSDSVAQELQNSPILNSVQFRLGLEFQDTMLESFLEVLNSPMKWIQQPSVAVLIREEWEREGGYLIPKLVPLLEHEDREIRVMAAQLLGGLRQTRVITPLKSRLKEETDEWVACVLMAGLANCGDRPEHWAATLEQKYLEHGDINGREGGLTRWNLALIIGSVQGHEFESAVRAVSRTSDGGLGPVVSTCQDLRRIYLERKAQPSKRQEAIFW